MVNTDRALPPRWADRGVRIVVGSYEAMTYAHGVSGDIESETPSLQIADRFAGLGVEVATFFMRTCGTS